jgi:hypothetical protein
MTDCERFEVWLDQGMPEAAPDDASRSAPSQVVSHAASCDRCAAALAAARQLDDALSAAAATAPAGFAERVMGRVARARTARLAALAEMDALPWWVRAAAEPAAALALALGALVLWQREALSRFTAGVLEAVGDPAVADWAHRIVAPRVALDLSTFSDPVVLVGVTLALVPFAWWAGLAVYHWSGDPSSLAPRRG